MRRMDVLTALLLAGLVHRSKIYSALSSPAWRHLSLEHGNTDGSCLAYVWLGGILGTVFRTTTMRGSASARLGLDLVEKRGLNRFQAPASTWTSRILVTPLDAGTSASAAPFCRRAFDAAQRGRRSHLRGLQLHRLDHEPCSRAGDPLSRRATRGGEWTRVRRGSCGSVSSSTSSPHSSALIRTLRGLTPRFRLLRRRAIRRAPLRTPIWRTIPAGHCRIAGIGSASCRRAFLAGDYASAPSRLPRKCSALLWTSPSHFEMAEYHFYAALARAAACDCSYCRASSRGICEALGAHHRQLELWAENCPENFREPRRAGRRGDCAPRGPRDRRRAPLRAGHPFGRAQRLHPQRGARLRTAPRTSIAARGFEDFAYVYLRKRARRLSALGR